MVAQIVAMAALTKSLDGAVNAIKSGLDLANKTQQASLALGMNLTTAKDRLGPSLDGLRGSIDQKMAAGFAGLEAGLQGNTKGVGKLINQQMLTGTNYAKTAKAFASLNAIAGVQTDAMNNMAEETIKSANLYGVSTDLLVDTMMSFEKNFVAMNMTGMGESFTAAVGNLQAQLGPQFKGQLQGVMGIIMDTGVEGMETLAALGIGDVRDQLQAAAGDTAATQAILEEALKTAGGSFKDIAGGASASLLSIGAATDALGAGSENFGALADALTGPMRIKQDAEISYADQMQVMIDEVWNPLKETVMDLVMGALPLFKIAAEFVAHQLQVLVTWFKETFVALGGFKGIIDKIKVAFDFMKPVLTLLAGVLLVKLAIILGPIIVIFVALTGVAKLLWEGLKALVSHFKDKLTPVTENLIKAWEWLKTTVDDLINNPMAFLKKAFFSFADFLGGLLTEIGSYLPDWMGGEGLSSMGAAMSEWAKPQAAAANAQLISEAVARDHQKKVEADFDAVLAADAEHFGFLSNKAAETAENTAEINRKTPDPSTGSEYMDQTSMLLSESMDRILGVQSSAAVIEKLEELVEATTDQTAVVAEQGPGFTSTFTDDSSL